MKIVEEKNKEVIINGANKLARDISNFARFFTQLLNPELDRVTKMSIVWHAYSYCFLEFAEHFSISTKDFNLLLDDLKKHYTERSKAKKGKQK